MRRLCQMSDINIGLTLYSRATVSTGRQTTAAVETVHSCYCLAAARHNRLAAAQPVGNSTAQIFSDCAITKYLSRAIARRPCQAITAN